MHIKSSRDTGNGGKSDAPRREHRSLAGGMRQNRQQYKKDVV